MRILLKNFLLTFPIISTSLCYAQQIELIDPNSRSNEFLTKMANQICDSIHSGNEHHLSDVDVAFEAIKDVTIALNDDWNAELEEYKASGKDEYFFYNYFQHKLLQQCPTFRGAEVRVDGYLESSPAKKIYNISKKIILELEDGTLNFKHLSSESQKALETAQSNLKSYKSSSTLTIEQSKEDPLKFVCLFRDYLSLQGNLKIELVYEDYKSSSPVEITTTSKGQLIRDENEESAFVNIFGN